MKGEKRSKKMGQTYWIRYHDCGIIVEKLSSKVHVEKLPIYFL